MPWKLSRNRWTKLSGGIRQHSERLFRWKERERQQKCFVDELLHMPWVGSHLAIQTSVIQNLRLYKSSLIRVHRYFAVHEMASTLLLYQLYFFTQKFQLSKHPLLPVCSDKKTSYCTTNTVWTQTWSNSCQDVSSLFKDYLVISVDKFFLTSIGQRTTCNPYPSHW